MDKKDKKENIKSGPSAITLRARPPVVVIMGHIDHGKSTLLDYIRKTNVVEEEAGGITQRISAYEVIHKDEKGEQKKITFLDTPGHEAFSKMRERGAEIADIAILIVAASEGVKTQTIEAWKTIEEAGIPCIVAINKIDKPEANVERVKTELAENGIYLENYGGKIPYVEISAKTGAGIDDLLLLILLLAEMENLSGNDEENASGFVIEANLDPRRGIEATLLLKNGSLKKGMTVAVENSTCSTRIMENFQGKMTNEVEPSSPVQIVGFNKIPRVGARFKSFKNKSEAEQYAKEWKKNAEDGKTANSRVLSAENEKNEGGRKIIPIVLKADVSGSLEAIEKEIAKIKSDGAEFKIVSSGVGSVSESDIKGIASEGDALVIGFNVKADKSATEIAQSRNITISFFDIIYKLTEWLEEEMEKRRPRVETLQTTGKAKIIRIFSRTKEKQVLGSKMVEGKISLNNTVRIMRREFEIGRGKITNLERNKTKVGAVEEGVEFGLLLESKTEVAPNDVIESFSIVHK